MTNGSLMKVESIAECSHPWSILQYVWPAFSDNWSLNPNFRSFLEWSFYIGFTVLHVVEYTFDGHVFLWIAQIFTLRK